MKIVVACLAAAVAALIAPEAAAGAKRWVCIGDSITRQTGFADVVCDDKLGFDGVQSEFWANQVVHQPPPGDVAVVLLGTNDARAEVAPEVYLQNMETLVVRFHERYKRLYLIVPPRTNSLGDTLHIIEYRTGLLDLCKRTKYVRCIDPEIVPSLHMEPGTGLHPNSAGHSLIAVSIARVQKRNR